MNKKLLDIKNEIESKTDLYVFYEESTEKGSWGDYLGICESEGTDSIINIWESGDTWSDYNAHRRMSHENKEIINKILVEAANIKNGGKQDEQ